MDFLDYFKKNKGFKRLFESLYEKYRSYGKIVGEIVLVNCTLDEKDAISGLTKKDFYRQKDIIIKVKNLEKIIATTKFKEYTLEEIVLAYFDGELKSKKDEKIEYEDKKDNFFRSLLKIFEGTLGFDVLFNAIRPDSSAYSAILRRYNENSKLFREDLMLCLEAINNLPCLNNDLIGLAVFASKISKNPHKFDKETSTGILLEHLICIFLKTEKPKNSFERSELLYNAGILIDEVSSNCLVYGLLAKKCNGEDHLGFSGFYNEGQPFLIPLFSLKNIENIYSNGDVVFVVENPSVFVSLQKFTQDLNPSLICTNGQVGLAEMLVLEKLAKEKVKIFYSGDFDPEGLMIANNLKMRLKDSIILWRYSVDDYNKCKSNEEISEIRLAKLNRIDQKDICFFELANEMKTFKRAGYQESIIGDLINDVSDILGAQNMKKLLEFK